MTAHSLKLVLLAVLTVAGLSTKAEAQSAWVGGMLGLSIPNADNTTARNIWGLTAGAKIGSEFGLAGYYLNSAKKENNTDFNYDLYGLEFAYHFEGEAKGVYLGGRIGTSKVTVGSNSISPMHWGVVGGYNHMMLSERFSLGADVSWLSVAEGTVSGMTVKAFSMLNFLATAKVGF